MRVEKEYIVTGHRANDNCYAPIVKWQIIHKATGCSVSLPAPAKEVDLRTAIKQVVKDYIHESNANLKEW